MKRRTKLTIETSRVLVIRGGPMRLSKCEACGAAAGMVTVDQAANLARVSSRAIYRLVEAGELHFTETPEKLLLVCFNSLHRCLLQAETRIVRESSDREAREE